MIDQTKTWAILIETVLLKTSSDTFLRIEEMIKRLQGEVIQCRAHFKIKTAPISLCIGAQITTITRSRKIVRLHCRYISLVPDL